jgi:hypothetical protein
MKIKFGYLSEKGIQTIIEEFNLYVFENSPNWGGELKKEGDEIQLILTTGNKWILNKAEGTLSYEGSRRGFNKMTPFKNVKLYHDHLLVYTVIENDIIEEMEKLLPIEYETTYPSLKWSEYLEPLFDMPEFAVVFDAYGTPRRVVPYKNVYKPSK